MSSFNTDNGFLPCPGAIILFFLSNITGTSETKVVSFDTGQCIFKGSSVKVNSGSFWMTFSVTVSRFSSAISFSENDSISSFDRPFEIVMSS